MLFCSEYFTVTLRESIRLVNGSNAQSAFAFGAVIPWCVTVSCVDIVNLLLFDHFVHSVYDIIA